MSLHTFFGPNASRKRPLDDSSSSSSAEAAPLPDPRTFVAWNADSLLTRVKKNASELGAFLATTKPDVVFVSEVRMPARAPPGAKPKDGKPRERGALSRADKKASEEAEAIGSLLARHQYRAYYSLADQKYAGSALLLRRGVAPPTSLAYNLDGGADAQRHDDEGRIILATWRSVELLGTYTPNNGVVEESFARRRAWDAKVTRFVASRAAAPAAGAPPLVYVGDLNVAAAWEDVGPSPAWFRNQNGQKADDPQDRGQPGFTEAEQLRFAEMCAAGALLDARRLTHPTPDWTADATWRGAPGAPPQPPEFGRYYNKGMRIDYALVHESLKGAVVRCDVLGRGPMRDGFMGSDHCPLLLELKV